MKGKNWKIAKSSVLNRQPSAFYLQPIFSHDSPIPTTVNLNCRPGYIGTSLRGQKGDKRGKLFRSTQPAHRYGTFPFFDDGFREGSFFLRGGLCEIADAVGQRVTGTNTIDGDIERSNLFPNLEIIRQQKQLYFSILSPC